MDEKRNAMKQEEGVLKPPGIEKAALHRSAAPISFTMCLSLSKKLQLRSCYKHITGMCCRKMKSDETGIMTDEPERHKKSGLLERMPQLCRLPMFTKNLPVQMLQLRS